ncbi:hypothetical protein TWF730_001543 [Orbilia blumenaviensis]|uniref:F-box domain-containing protein n=1 Tax=Orbilia blumenaviensis TaxID=1796055 RepID=A0AAV9UIR9_9PEZI
MYTHKDSDLPEETPQRSPSATITSLPTELLLPILTDVLSSRSFKARDVARLASVCRRFYTVVVKYLYSNCDILLHRREGYSLFGHAAALPRFSGESVHDTLANAGRTLQAYKNHGKEVRILSLKTVRGTAFTTQFQPYQGPLKFIPSLPTFTANLTKSFPSLTNLTIEDTLHTTPLPVETFLEMIQTILKTSQSLKHLCLKLSITRSSENSTMSRTLLLQGPSPLYPENLRLSSLESLTLDIHLNAPPPRASQARWMHPPVRDPQTPIWLLSALPNLFPSQSLSTVTSLSFTVTGHTPPKVLTAANSQIIGAIDRLSLPALEDLTLSVTTGCVHVFQQYISSPSYRTVRNLEVRDTYELGIQGLITLLTTSFSSLTTLTLKKIDVRRKPVNFRFLQYLKSSTALETLKSVTIYTSALPQKIAMDMGTVFMTNTVLGIKRERIATGEREECDGAQWRVIVEFAF